MKDILTPVSPGELLDKLTILAIKLDRISDEEKLINVQVEYDLLSKIANDVIPATDEVSDLNAQLLRVNTQLWRIEDDIRDCERTEDFGENFIRLARAVYQTNDKRAHLKKQINLALGSVIIEEKSYADY